jgi:hypothetical protein
VGVWYATREDVVSALEMSETSRTFAQVDRLIEAASRSVDELCRRKFFPTAGTRYIAWPDRETGDFYRVYLGEDEVISLSSVVSGGVALTDYFLEPQSSGPPYARLELNLGGSEALAVASGIGQRSLALTGVFGASADLTTVGTIAEALDASETGVDVSGGSIGVGALLKVDSEYMQVTGRSLVDTGVTTSGALTAAKNANSVVVSSAASFTADEVITVGAERMLITDIAGSTLIVVRGWSGSTLAAHNSGVAVYSPRTLTVLRGQLGTTAATHSTSTAVGVHTPPPLIRQLTIGIALDGMSQEQSGYARTIGTGDQQRNLSGRGLAQLTARVQAAHGAGLRKGAI